MSDEKHLTALTPIFRVSYPRVFKAVKNDLNGRDEFSLQALYEIKKDDPAFAAIKNAANAAIVKKWGASPASWPEKMKSPFRDQSEKAKGGALQEGLVAGHVFMTFKSETRPAIVDRDGVSIITEPSRFYAGCYARALVYASAYDQKGNRGVTFYLNHLQFVKDGPPLSGRPQISGAFSAIETDDQPSGTSASDLF